MADLPKMNDEDLSVLVQKHIVAQDRAETVSLHWLFGVALAFPCGLLLDALSSRFAS